MLSSLDYLGGGIRRLRESKGVLQKGLAQQAGVKASRLSEYETGKHIPSLPVLHRLLEVMGSCFAELEAAMEGAEALRDYQQSSERLLVDDVLEPVVNRLVDRRLAMSLRAATERFVDARLGAPPGQRESNENDDKESTQG